MRIVSLTGWGQPSNSLQLAGLEHTPIPYDMHDGVDPALQAIAEAGKGADAVIGWSLGGQLASMAIAKGYMQPKKLVLIASPFQFVHSDILPLGMPRLQFNTFRDNYEKNPKRTLDKAWELVIKDDRKAEELRGKYLQHGKEEILEQNWLSWLQRLDELSCHGLPFDHFPPTLLLHGDNDVVVKTNQSHHYTQHILDATLVTFSDCAHAPHWHDPQKAERTIKEFLHV